MIKLSAVVIARNAEDLIADCIYSVNFAEEIIVIDNNSADRTKELAKRLGTKVIETKTENFADLRNLGLKHSKGEWILYVDTDERVSKELKINIETVIASETKQSGSSPKIASSTMSPRNDVVAYRLHRQNFYLGNHPWPKIEKLERLFKKSALKEWFGELHESPRVKGEIGELEGLLLHYTHRDLSSMLVKTMEWSEKEARLRFNVGHPKMVIWRFPRVMITAFWNSYVSQKGWKIGVVGLIESTYQAFSIFVTYARLWEMQNKK